MGVLEYFRARRSAHRYARMLNGQTPVFSQFGQNIYASDVVQQAVTRIVNEMKKLQPTHVRRSGTDVEPVKGPVQTVLDAPNPLMTTSELIEKIIWMRELNYNAFVLPTRSSTGELTGLWPVQPEGVEYRRYVDDALYAHFRFGSGFECDVPYDDVIHIRKNYAVNEFMGGNALGQPDNGPLLKTLQMNHELLNSVGKALKSSYALNAVVKYNTMLDRGKQEADIAELEAKLKANESGFLPMDLKSEFIPLERNLKLVDTDLLKFLDAKILRNYGVPLCILTGDFTTEQMAAFYQGTLETIVVSLNQAFTKALFSGRERAMRNEIVFYPEELVFINTAQKLEMARIFGDRGSMYENEMRAAFGLKPLPELAGKRMQSLNYVDVEIAGKYQLARKLKEKDGGEAHA